MDPQTLDDLKLKKKPNVIIKKQDMIIKKYEDPVFKPIDESLKPNEEFMTFQEDQVKFLWTAKEIHCNLEDIKKFKETADEATKSIILSILLFFTVVEKLVLSNLEKIEKIVPYKGAQYYFKVQSYIETVHDMIYEKAARLYYDDDEKFKKDKQLMNNVLEEAEKCPDEIFDLDNYDCKYYQDKNDIEKSIFKAVVIKINSVNRWKYCDSILLNIIGFFIIESISFNALFAFIDTFKSKNIGLKFLIDINEFVLRDESLHARFGMFLYKNFVENKIPENEFYNILKDITDTEINFIKEIMPDALSINNLKQSEYIIYLQNLANDIAKNFISNKIYDNVIKPRPEFSAYNIHIKANFFERNSPYIIDDTPVNKEDILKQYKTQKVILTSSPAQIHDEKVMTQIIENFKYDF